MPGQWMVLVPYKETLRALSAFIILCHYCLRKTRACLQTEHVMRMRMTRGRVYTETLMPSFSKTFTLSPVFKSLRFQYAKTALLCKWTAKTLKKYSIYSWNSSVNGLTCLQRFLSGPVWQTHHDCPPLQVSGPPRWSQGHQIMVSVGWWSLFSFPVLKKVRRHFWKHAKLDSGIYLTKL